LNRLRTVSTRKLLTLCALTLIVIAGGTTVAFATSDSGPKPEPKPLANAVHDALGAPEVPGISADIHFTNNLIDASSIEGNDPLMTGATGRLWASPANGGMLRLELQAEEGGNDSQVLVQGRDFEIYDGTSETVYRGTMPEEEGKQAEREWKVPSVARIQKAIDRVGKHADLSGAEPASVAGQPAYTLEATPSHDGGLLGGVQVSWDSENGIPLRGAVYAAGSSDPVLELEATEISFEAVDSSVFDISPPAEAEVVDLTPQELEGPEGAHKDPTIAKGVDAVARAVPFQLTAPDSLAGLSRSEVSAIEIDGHTAALATYGKGLGGIAVIESAVQPDKEKSAQADGEEAELTLPEVVISDGVKGEELDTALGSVLRFQRDGVEYMLVGSVPPAAIEAAARGL
jgi:outer membrane lipoprotein-sorting protein